MENAPAEKKKRAKDSDAETETAPQAEKASERIGHMLMAASEKAPISHTGKSALEAVRRQAKNFERSLEKPLLPDNKSVETLSRAQLLNISEQIVVDGSSLRQIYETHLVGERGLRHLVEEYLQGGDVKRAIRQEIIEREIDFERDPAMRDHAQDSVEDVKKMDISKANRAALNKLLDEAASEVQDSSEEAAFFKARALYEAQQLEQHKQQRRWVDVVLTVAIITLLILVIILLSRR